MMEVFKNKKNKRIGFFVFGMLICFALVCTVVKSETPNVIAVDTEDCTLDIMDNGENGEGKREIMVDVNNVKSGRRITNFEICYQNADCSVESNWTELDSYVSAYINGIGNNSISIGLTTPIEPIKIRAKFTDFEPMDISYAKYNLETEDENQIRQVYVEGLEVRENYDENFTNIVTGYKGGDIVLPSGCTDNGCLLKVTISNDNYDSIMSRLNDFNNNHNMDDESRTFVELGSMNNHLDRLPIDSIYLVEDNNGLMIETNGDTKSFYMIVSKFFSEKNRSDFVVGDNRNRILSEDYIGLQYRVDRKHFDEGNEQGFLTFNEFNEYKQDATLFYGAPLVKFEVDAINLVSLTSTGDSSGMGTPKYVYTKIVSRDQDKFPINNSFELTITSFYEQDYTIPLALKNNDNETVKNITLNLSRFAFGGNAGGLLLVDDKGINCRQSWMNPNCSNDNIYVSTEYRGLYDTFYSNGETDSIDSFEISKQDGVLNGRFIGNEVVYRRNEDFSPWATAIYYHDDEVVYTKSFDLGELVKVEGYSNDVIENDLVNGKAKEFGDEFITNYDSSNYTIFGYGLGFEKPINRIKYFKEGTYRNANITQTLILASKQEILENDINRIALFLTNGELKSDEANFPELTYGVGEGKIFYVDGRTFEELGGGE